MSKYKIRDQVNILSRGRKSSHSTCVTYDTYEIREVRENNMYSISRLGNKHCFEIHENELELSHKPE